MVPEKALESPLDCKEIKLVNSKGNQSFIGKTDAEALILWPHDAKSWLIGKDPDAGKEWRKEEKGMAQDEIDSITDLMDMNSNKLKEIVKGREARKAAVTGLQRVAHVLATKQQKQYFKSSSAIKNPSAMQEMGTGSLGQEDPLEKMVTHSSNLAWEFPYSPWDRKHSTQLSNQTTVVF